MPLVLTRPVLIYVSTSRRLAYAIKGSPKQNTLLELGKEFIAFASVDSETHALAVLDKLYPHSGGVADGYYYIYGSQPITKAEIEAEADKIEQAYRSIKGEKGELLH